MMSARGSGVEQVRKSGRGNVVWRASLVLLAAGCLAAAGCSSGAATTVPSTAGRTLNIGTGFTPNSLDPGKINAAFNWYIDLAYDPLIYKAPDGSLQPRLATSWNYIGTGNTAFELHLRPNVKFSDGSPLTADVVKANIDHFRQAGSGAAPYLAPIKTVEVVDPLTIRLTLSTPDPLLPQVFTQDYQAGDIISGPALRQPQKLATRTFGAGPYVLDTSGTIANDHYAYTPNHQYWNKGAQHYDRIVIKVLPNPNTALAALKTGQVDVIQGDQTTVKSAKSAGLQVTDAPQVVWGLALADRAGKIAPALGDVRVRQALNYAVDRRKITTALFQGYGMPTEQLVLPGQDGASTNIYTYDPNKAKQLLAQAGYPHGFTLPTLASPNGKLLAQAIAQYLRAIGVHLQITTDTSATQYLTDMASGKFPTYLMGYGTKPVYLLGPGLFLPTAAQFNPFRTADPQIQSLYDQAAGAAPQRRSQLDQQIIGRLDQQAWFVPTTFGPVFMFHRSTVSGVQITRGRPTADPVEWTAA